MPRPRFVIGGAATALSLAGIFMAAASAPLSIEELRRLITQGHYAEAESGARALLFDVEARSGSDSVEAADVVDLLVEGPASPRRSNSRSGLWLSGKQHPAPTRRRPPPASGTWRS